MGLLEWIFGSSSATPARPASQTQPADPRHALVLHLVADLSKPDAADASGGVIERYHAIQDELEAAVLRHHAGVLDGDEWGDAVCTVYFYGPDADALWDAVAPILEKHPFPKGSYAVREYGPPGTRDERIDLSWDG